jgi:hypothetical protein
MGALLAGGRLVRRAARTAGQVTGPVVRLAVDPPLVPYRWRPLHRLERWGRDWQQRRDVLLEAAVRAGSELTARSAQQVLPLVDLTPVVQGVLERLDLDAIASDTLDVLDLRAVVDQAIDELDVSVVLNQALSEVDLTRVVVEQVELGAVVGQALDAVDLTSIVLTRIDLGRVVTAALDQLDLTAIVQQRVDLAEIAEQVVEDIDLPDIIQESTGSVASEAVQAARLRSVDADERLSGLVDRVLLRVRGRRLESGATLDEDSEPEDQT